VLLWYDGLGSGIRFGIGVTLKSINKGVCVCVRARARERERERERES